MPVYTVHAPVTSNWDLRTTDRFTFVRDGFHVWAALFGVVWLAWNRLWLALIGWIVLMIVVDVAMIRFGVGPAAVVLVDCLLALLLGFEQADILDRDRRLIGKGRQQRNVLLLEWPHLRPAHHDCAEGATFTHQRHAENGAMAEPDRIITSARELLPGILLVVDMNRLHVANRSPRG